MKDNQLPSTDGPAKPDYAEEWQQLAEGEIRLWKELYKQGFEHASKKLGNTLHVEKKKDIFKMACERLLVKVRQGSILTHYKPIALLKGIVNKVCLEHWRAEKRELSMLEGVKRTIEKVYKLKEAGDKIFQTMLLEESGMKCFQQLQPECQQVLTLTIFEKKTHREVAEIMNYTIKFVKMKRHRCMKHLRDCMRKSAPQTDEESEE